VKSKKNAVTVPAESAEPRAVVGDLLSGDARSVPVSELASEIADYLEALASFEGSLLRVLIRPAAEKTRALSWALRDAAKKEAAEGGAQ
jgi:hypothetical protein